ncbi:DUF4911 domain-containing protein [Desulforhopalus sp. IMCC35007]|uniref:DUF4911 domain-containing protein n=1 Tax=Desulforhopalus sp. IMCC35007 TaxID=2569543 RepID=UPI00145DC9F4|nr:DUF4911 domain-containing protein [Desulforhopalus sp. IMCC35007]
METDQKTLHSLFLRISPGRFHFLKFILEGYDNLAILSSVESREGIVVIRYPEGHKVELFALLVDIAADLVE